VNKWVSGEWVIERTNAKQRRVLHYWLTILWFTVGLAIWIVLRHALWFVGFMSLYAIWITHLAGWAAETPVEPERGLAASPAGNSSYETTHVSSEAVPAVSGK
jgi:hypothetical protein